MMSVRRAYGAGLSFLLGSMGCDVNEPRLDGPAVVPAPPAVTARHTPPSTGGAAAKTQQQSVRATLEYRLGDAPARTIVMMASGPRVRFDVPSGIDVDARGGAGPTRLIFDSEHDKGVVVRDDDRKARVFAMSRLTEHVTAAWLPPLLDGWRPALGVVTHGQNGTPGARLEVKDLVAVDFHPSDFRIPKEYDLVDLTRPSAETAQATP